MRTEPNVARGDGASADAPDRQRAVREAMEPSLGELFRQLAQETNTLVRQEVSLARAELRDNVRGVARAAVLMAVGGGALLLAALALTAFLITLLGEAIASYWLAALLIGAVYAGVGAALVVVGRRQLNENRLKPEHTIETLREDGRWARAELEQVKSGLQS